MGNIGLRMGLYRCSPVALEGTHKARPNADASEAGFRYGFAYIVCSTKCMTNRSEMI